MDKKKEFEELKTLILQGFKKADCKNQYTQEPYPYFDSQINCIAKVLIDNNYCKTDVIEKETAKNILTILHELCKVRKEIEWDDIWFLVKRYGIEVE